MDSNQILRFTTAGSVDDGKSTLIGRLLYDSRSIFEDQLDAVKKNSVKKGMEIDLAMFTDGLRDERDQGITIDVAYRYFTTPRRKFIIADTPGHIQYTRNMVTGASTADAALILVDARSGVVEQTRRHSFIANLLGIPHLIVCVNKMDLVGYDQGRFEAIKAQFEQLREQISVPDVRYIPISALQGDNVVSPSTNTPWFTEAPLLRQLEDLEIHRDRSCLPTRFPVQTIIRTESPDYLGLAGSVASGVLSVGDAIRVFPSGDTATIKTITRSGQPIQTAHPPMAVVLTLEEQLQIARGDLLVAEKDDLKLSRSFEAYLCWLNERPAQMDKGYLLKHTTKEHTATIEEILFKTDVNTLQPAHAGNEIRMNDICKVQIRASEAIAADLYQLNRSTGSFILIDAESKETVAAGMIG